jgi:indole-3-glycerol phosphate synthase
LKKKTISLRNNLINSTSGIAEHKRRSPSKAEINYSFTVEEVTPRLRRCRCLRNFSIDRRKYFGGSLDDLLLARATVNIPLLRKNFVDEYQILEAKAYGVDLLIGSGFN